VSFNAVRLRRHPTSKDFKGSLFIELTSKEEAERVRAQHSTAQHSGGRGAGLLLDVSSDVLKGKVWTSLLVC